MRTQQVVASNAELVAGIGAPASARREAQPSVRSSLLVVAAAVLTAAAGSWLLLTAPTRGEFDEVRWWVNLATVLLTIGIGLVGWRARPGNRVGPLLVIYGFAVFVSWLSHSGHPVAWTLGNMWYLAGTVVLANIYLAFPDGRTRGWSRSLVVAIYTWYIVVTVARQLTREYPPGWPWQNPFAIWPNAQLSDAIAVVGYLGGIALAILVVATVIERWRRGSSTVRRALAPVFWVSPIFLAVNGLHFLGYAIGADALIDLSTSPLAQLTRAALPAAFLVGLLRTRLDQASIADLVRDLEHVTPGQLEPALAAAIRDPSLRVAFPTPAGDLVDADGDQLALPADDPSRALTRVGTEDPPLAILVHDAAVDPDIVAAAAAASRLSLENARLTAELRAQLEAVRSSRSRIVEAADRERRRLERDLHDGAQQRLVALGFVLRDATRRAQGDPELAGVLDGAQTELESGLRELRALARGLHPTALDDGLAPAVRDLADRSPVPVEVDLQEVPLPAAVESTAYFIVAEALTNALRHAQAARIVVRGTAVAGRLRLEIRDDGLGGATEAKDGSGMRGLADRAQALGGSLHVESPDGAGTTVVAELPLA